MAVSHANLPRDGNGIVQGAYRILHESPAFHGDIGIYEMREGSSVSPACGRALICAIGEYGAQLYLDPWGPLPDGFAMPELVSAEVPEDVARSFEPCPWRMRTATVRIDVTGNATSVAEAGEGLATVTVSVAPVPDDLDAMNVDDLRALAALHDVAIDGRWREPKLREALRSAGVTG